MIALRFRERVLQRLARFNQRGDRLLDVGNRTPGPVFRLHKIENLTIFGKTGDEPGHDAAQRGKILVSGKIFDLGNSVKNLSAPQLAAQNSLANIVGSVHQKILLLRSPGQLR